MFDGHHTHEPRVVVNLIHQAPVADTHSPRAGRSSELLHARRARVLCETPESGKHAGEDGRVERLQLLAGRGEMTT
jgi:hypothetical protein